MISSQKKIEHPTPQAYANAAALAIEVGEEMLARLQWIKLDPNVIVDVGTRTGHFAKLLQARFPAAKVCGVDVSDTMLKFAERQAENISWIHAEMASLPFPDHSVDLLFANLVLPWCGDTNAVFQEWRRVLRPGGLLMFTALGPDTFLSSRDMWSNYLIPDLTDMHVHGDALTKFRFADPVMDVLYFTLQYQDPERLLSELVLTGMLTSDAHGALCEKIRESQSPENWKAEYEVVFGHAFGTEVTEDFSADEFGTVKIPLVALRRRMA